MLTRDGSIVDVELVASVPPDGELALIRDRSGGAHQRTFNDNQSGGHKLIVFVRELIRKDNHTCSGCMSGPIES
jgi:hypothetical protein